MERCTYLAIICLHIYIVYKFNDVIFYVLFRPRVKIFCSDSTLVALCREIYKYLFWDNISSIGQEILCFFLLRAVGMLHNDRWYNSLKIVFSNMRGEK